MTKISLCMIVGNVETYIERCLRSFAPLCDEIVLVRAIGAQTPDQTRSIATKVCQDLGKPLVWGEYENQKGHERWEHIDSFAAARQKSFNLATGDFCFWCDSDDVLESGAEIVRELAERGGYSCFVFPYNIFGRGVVVPRERMIAKGSGKWHYPVHECFKFLMEPVQAVEDERVVVRHLPNMDKTGSHDRNLRILQDIPEAEMTPGLWYHLQGELAGAGDIEGSVNAARKALEYPDLGKAERYELFLNLARLAGDPKQKKALLIQAYACDPTRREALGLLVSVSLDYAHNVDALAYARQMMATAKPADKQWNDRVAAYGWIGTDFYTQALRANGRYDDANIVRMAALQEAGGPAIALVHATRGRPQQAALARKMWLDSAERPEMIEHIFVFDKDDEESQVLQRMHHLAIPPGGGCVAAWNTGAFMTNAPIIVQMSDDWIPPAGWDKSIVERLGDLTQPKVLAVSDGHRTDKLICMAICTRAYLNCDYFLFHPGFTGVYSDNYFTELAYKRNAVIEAKDLVFVHDHPIFKQLPQIDETYALQNSPERYKQGKETFEYLQTGSDWSSCEGFFNYWPFYQQVAARLQDGDEACEVGVWMGRSIIFLAQELKRLGKKVKLYAVDTFAGELNQPVHEPIVAAHGGSLLNVFKANMKRCNVEDMIEIVQSDSAAAAKRFLDKSLAFVYIDAAHDYDSVKRDVAAWKDKVKPLGTFAGHDAQHEPVMKAVREEVGSVKDNGCVWWKV